jgi:hypothetical protein
MLKGSDDTPISQSTLRALTVEQVLSSRNSEMIIYLPLQESQSILVLPPSKTSTSMQTPALLLGSGGKRKALDDPSPGPAPKRRGRPPKVKQNDHVPGSTPTSDIKSNRKSGSRNTTISTPVRVGLRTRGQIKNADIPLTSSTLPSGQTSHVMPIEPTEISTTRGENEPSDHTINTNVPLQVVPKTPLEATTEEKQGELEGPVDVAVASESLPKRLDSSDFLSSSTPPQAGPSCTAFGTAPPVCELVAGTAKSRSSSQSHGSQPNHKDDPRNAQDGTDSLEPWTAKGLLANKLDYNNTKDSGSNANIASGTQSFPESSTESTQISLSEIQSIHATSVTESAVQRETVQESLTIETRVLPSLPLVPKEQPASAQAQNDTTSQSKNRHQTFTTQDHLDWEAGTPRAYLNPPGCENPASLLQKGRRSKATSYVAVVRSEKLKDPNWLHTRSGTWIEVSAERLAGRLIEAEDEMQSPQKRGKRKLGNSVDIVAPQSSKKFMFTEDHASGVGPLSTGEIEAHPTTPLTSLQTSLSAKIPKGVLTDDPNCSSTEDATISQSPTVQQLDQRHETYQDMSQTSSLRNQNLQGDESDTITLEPHLSPNSSQLPSQAQSSPLNLNTSGISPRPAKTPYRDCSVSPPQKVSKSSIESNQSQSSSPKHAPAPYSSPYNSPYSMARDASTKFSQKEPPSDLARKVASLGQSNEAASRPYQSPFASQSYIPSFARNSVSTPVPINKHQTQSQQLQAPQRSSPSATILSPHRSQNSSTDNGVHFISQSTSNSGTLDQSSPKPQVIKTASQHERSLQSQQYGPHATMVDFHRRYSSSYAPQIQRQTRYPSDQVHHEIWASESASRSQISPPTAGLHPQKAMSDFQSTSDISMSQIKLDVVQRLGAQPVNFAEPELQNTEGSLKQQNPSTEAGEEPSGSTRPTPPLESCPDEAVDNTPQLDESLTHLPEPDNQAKPKRKYTRKLKDEKKQKEDKTSTLLSPANEITVPDDTTRLACVFKEVIGNLLLSKEMTELQFFDVERKFSETPMFTIAITDILRNPITSVPGSKVMELRVKSKGDNDTEITHCFLFAPTPSSSDDANSMRAKIVTAMIAHRFRAGEEYDRPTDVVQQLKKYHCDKCGSRFKNINGLQYHETKSNTPCNPNSDPSKFKPRGRQPKIKKTDGGPGEVENRAGAGTPYICEKCGSTFKGGNGLEYHKTKSNTTCNPNFDPAAFVPRGRPRKVERAPSDPGTAIDPENSDQDNDSDSTNASDDSIVKWALKHSTTGLEAVPRKADGDSAPDKSRNTSRLYKALNRETERLLEIIQKIITASTKDLIDPAPVGNALADPENSTNNLEQTVQIADQLLLKYTEPDMSDNLCETILFAIVQENGGIFPGERSLWFACVAVWLKMHPVPKSLPRSTLCAKAVDSLIFEKRLERTAFSFQDDRKRHITRSIVHTPGADLKSSQVAMLKNLIQESCPSFYLPLQFSPPSIVLQDLQALASRALPKKSRVQEVDTAQSDDVEPESPPTPVVEDELSDSDEFVDDEAPAPDSESEADIEPSDGVGESDEESLERSHKKRPKLTNDKRGRTAKHNAAIAEGVRRKWADIRAGGDNPFERGYALRRNDSRKNKGLTKSDQEQRANKAAHDQQSWGLAVSFLPNPETGAWNQVPLKSKAKYNNRRLTEPVTYLQDLNGSWSVRPFGHGVTPIFARPSRRGDGNPNFGKYLNKIQNGFRPIVYPKNSRIQPPPPSSKTLAEPSSDQEIEGLPSSVKSKRKPPKRTLDKSTVAQSIESEDGTSSARISELTGKPIRIYKRKFQRDSSTEPEEELESAHPFASANPFTDSKYLKKNASRSHPTMTEVDILNFFEPKKLSQEAPLNPGLETLPLSFGLKPSICLVTRQEDLEYSQSYEVQWRTPRDVDQIQANPNYGSWTMDHLATPEDVVYNFRWDDQTAFTLETLPYELLQEDTPLSSVPVEGDSPPPKRRRFTVRDKYTFSRILTTQPKDFTGLFDDPYEAVEEFGVQMAGPVDFGRKRRQKPIGAVMNPIVEAKFLVTVVVVRTLLGGLDNLVDWVIVQLLFPEISQHFMAKYWADLSKRKKSAIENLTVDFQRAFVEAYEKGEVASLDFDRLPEYDWEALVDWAMKNVDSQMGNKSITLPETRQDFDEQFHYMELDRHESGWRDNFYMPGAPVYRRVETSAAEPHTTFCEDTQVKTFVDIDDLTVAKSWVRAIAMTPQKDYSTDVAGAHMADLGKKLAQKAMDILVTEKVIVHRSRKRAVPGRSHEIADNFSKPLQTKHMRPEMFIQAADYKRWLDDQFRSGLPYIRADYMANDGAIMCITSLQAHGRIKLVPIGVPMDKFGLTEGGYETRQIPSERLRFDMEIYPTSTYLFDNDNLMLHQTLNAPEPVGSDKGEIPVWFGITGVKITDIWNKVLMAVGQILALRSGTDMVWLRHMFKATMEEWEFRLLLKWGEDLGFFKRISQNIEGWTVGEWWWLVVGRSFLGQRD